MGLRGHAEVVTTDAVEGDVGHRAGARRALIDISLEFAALPGRLPVPADLETTTQHAMFGPLNSRAWFLFQRIHDTDHVNQLAALRITEGFPS